MQAVVLEAFQEPLTVQDVDRPEPEPDGAVAGVVGCGVCRSDWHCWQGDWDWFGYRPDPPHVPGHEPTGRIVAVGDEVETDEFVAKEIEFKGSLGLQPSRYSEMLDMIESSKLDPTALVAETVTIHEVPDELAAMTDFDTAGIPVCTDFSS